MVFNKKHVFSPYERLGRFPVMMNFIIMNQREKQSCHHTETSRLIFYTLATLAFSHLRTSSSNMPKSAADLVTSWRYYLHGYMYWKIFSGKFHFLCSVSNLTYWAEPEVVQHRDVLRGLSKIYDGAFLKIECYFWKKNSIINL